VESGARGVFGGEAPRIQRAKETRTATLRNPPVLPPTNMYAKVFLAVLAALVGAAVAWPSSGVDYCNPRQANSASQCSRVNLQWFIQRTDCFQRFAPGYIGRTAIPLQVPATTYVGEFGCPAPCVAQAAKQKKDVTAYCSSKNSPVYMDTGGCKL
jgi:hypothetical protein